MTLIGSSQDDANQINQKEIHWGVSQWSHLVTIFQCSCGFGYCFDLNFWMCFRFRGCMLKILTIASLVCILNHFCYLKFFLCTSNLVCSEMLCSSRPLGWSFLFRVMVCCFFSLLLVFGCHLHTPCVLCAPFLRAFNICSVYLSSYVNYLFFINWERYENRDSKTFEGQDHLCGENIRGLLELELKTGWFH